MSHSPQYKPAQPQPVDAPTLISDAIRQMNRLVQSEVALAKREMKSKLTRAGLGIALIVVAGFLVLSALDVLTAALVAGIAAMGLPVWLASLIVAGIALALAAAFFVVGRTRIMPDTLVPEETVKNLRKDIAAIKETTHV